jgi:hypothetical protein
VKSSPALRSARSCKDRANSDAGKRADLPFRWELRLRRSWHSVP